MSAITDTKYDLRKNPFTQEWDAGLPHPTNEEYTIPAASPFHITLEEVPKYEDPSTVFIYLTDTLNGDVLIGDGTITVDNGSYWATNDILKIDNEYLLITGVAGNDLAVTRGYGDSVAAAHGDGTQFKNMGANEIVQADPLINGVDKFTEKTTTPSQGEFEVHYGTSAIPYKRGLIQFHEDDAEKIVWVEYIKTGHYNWAEHINDLQNCFPVAQVNLKTATGSVNFNNGSGNNTFVIASNCNWGTYFTKIGLRRPDGITHLVDLILPGGEYGFYPQTKVLATYTYYAQQRYITASSDTHWVFLLYDQVKKQIVAGYEAPDHPSYGNGGDEEKVPHPFVDYLNKPLPSNLQIILLDNSKLGEIKGKRKRNRGILEIISEEYEIDFSGNPVYEPRDIIEIDEFNDLKGEIIRDLGDGKKLKKRTVTKLPDYILYKKLKE